jgi:hypothetical protein
VKTAYVVSPIEPSGASWLLNCLLELDVKVGHKPCVDTVWRRSRPRPGPEHVWQEAEGRFALRPKAALLRKWLPACSRHETFAFQRGLTVHYVQDLPEPHHRDEPVLYFVRDPRDAMFSMYRRVGPDMSCLEYVRFPDPRSLRGRIDHWGLHVRAWAEQPGVRFLRFEDYKRDAAAVLAQALDVLGLEVDPAALANAVRESTFEKAAGAEQRYRRVHPRDREVVNRSGRVGDWRAHPELTECMELVERRVGDVLRRFDYPARAETAAREGDVLDLRLFAETVDEATLRGSRLPPDDVVALLDALAHALAGAPDAVRERLAALRARFGDGGAHHFERLRELRARLASAGDAAGGGAGGGS